ncbi:MAG TPA: glycosyltransferase, partial [Saprospiraceae bacterium]|nr:glycosyltransferase [Saprospiraceae bacterium]
GTLGIIAFFIGFIILIELSIEKIFFKVGGIADRPLFFLGMLATIIGSQLFLTGFLAELITRNSPSRNNYLIEEKIHL